MQRQTTYRGDIDGLRAVAVLAILVFHLSPAALPGGFVGVDIFFVISGYLITGQILALGDRFTFRDFYLRRLLRLYPALLLVVAATLVAGYLRLAPAEFRSLAASALAAVFGVSNVWFFHDIDYFHPETAFRPLLHTWSLGVEEQFYLAWPLLLTVLAGRRVRFAVLMVAVLVAGLVLAVAGPRLFGPSATFYLMPFRIHQFALGAVLHVLPAVPLVSETAARRIQGLCLALLVLIFALPDAGLWRPLHAFGVVACLATAIIVGLGAAAPLRMLAAAPVRRVGRWSYSIYLVHWPLIVFARDIKVVPLGPADLAALFAASVLLGGALHALVEQRLRLRGAADRLAPFVLKLRLSLLGVLAGVTAAAAVAVILTDGLPRRLGKGRVQATAADLTFAGDVCNSTRSVCAFGDKASSRVVHVIGDSHAMNLFHGLDTLFRETGVRGVAYYDHGCLFLKGTRRIVRGVPDAACEANVEAAFAALEADKTSPVIYAGAWNDYATEIGPKGGPAFAGTGKAYVDWVEQRLTESLKTLAAGGRPVVLVGLSYDSGPSVPQCLLRPGHPDEATCGFATRDAARRRDADIEAMLARAAAAAPSIVLVEPKAVFCREEACKVREGDTLLLRDSVHLTNAGSDFLVSGLRDRLVEALR